MERWRALQGGPLIIVVGEVLLLLCSLSYLAWWVVTFRPGGRTSSGGGLFLSGAILGGLGGLVLLIIGIVALLPRASWSAPALAIVGGVLGGALLLWLTSTIGQRPVTTELPLIIVWTTAQLAAGLTLRTAGVLDPPSAWIWIGATAAATIIGLVCYLIFYRLDTVPAYWVGMVPLAVDGLVAAALAAVTAFGRTP